MSGGVVSGYNGSGWGWWGWSWGWGGCGCPNWRGCRCGRGGAGARGAGRRSLGRVEASEGIAEALEEGEGLGDGQCVDLCFGDVLEELLQDLVPLGAGERLRSGGGRGWEETQECEGEGGGEAYEDSQSGWGEAP